ncbi:MAG: type II toxin-antitoxin system VapC family toxin [Pyrinomonadaceae bacterium]
MIVVVDASVLVKWYVDEDHTAEAELLADPRFEIHAPELLLPEFGNILWKKCQNEDLDENVARSALAALRSHRVILHSNATLVESAFLGAQETGQSVYDWTYLSLAIALDCKFVTADRKFYIGLRKTRFKEHALWVEDIPTLV